MQGIGSDSPKYPQTPRAEAKGGKLYIDKKEYKMQPRGRTSLIPQMEAIIHTRAAAEINSLTGIFNPKEGLKLGNVTYDVNPVASETETPAKEATKRPPAPKKQPLPPATKETPDAAPQKSASRAQKARRQAGIFDAIRPPPPAPQHSAKRERPVSPAAESTEETSPPFPPLPRPIPPKRKT